MSSQEKLYNQLNKMLTFYLQALKWALIPLTLILFVVAVYWGLDLNNARKEVKNLYAELSEMSTNANLTYREFLLSNNEFSNEMEKKYSSLYSSFDSINLQYNKIVFKSDSLFLEALSQLNRNNDLYNSLLSDSKSLGEFKQTIIESVNDADIMLNEVKKEYNAEIEFAKIGADEKLELVDELYAHNLEMFSIFRKLVILNTEISLLSANMSKFWASSEQRKLDEEKIIQINQKVVQINSLVNDKVFFEMP